MRIEAFAQVQQLYNQKGAKQLRQGSVASFSDQLQISSMGKDIGLAKKAVADAPDVREDLVASIKERINDGTYGVETETLAQSLFERFRNI